MRTIMIYEAEDGRQFPTGDACAEYEQQCRDIKEANEMWRDGATLMEVLTRANKTRPGWDYMLRPKDRMMLQNATKETKVTVDSGQCNNPHICNIERIYSNGYVGLQGDVYGLYASLADLLRYAHQTTM